MRRFKSYLLILIALWLPLQAAAAVTMPFCQHGTEQPLAMEATHCHEQMDASPTSLDAFNCDNCQMCHLATAGFLLAGVEMIPLHTASVLVPNLEQVSASHIPEPPQQPPRR
jgi:hypothetical protein